MLKIKLGCSKANSKIDTPHMIKNGNKLFILFTVRDFIIIKITLTQNIIA
jgi:hypothetical protein